MGDDPYPEIEDVHSSRIEDCEPMRMASLIFHQFDKDQAWMVEDQAQPEKGYPTSKPILQKCYSLLYSLPAYLRVYDIANRALSISGSVLSQGEENPEEVRASHPCQASRIPL